MSGAKIKKNTKPLHGILPAHGHYNFKTDRNLMFWDFSSVPTKIEGIIGLNSAC